MSGFTTNSKNTTKGKGGGYKIGKKGQQGLWMAPFSTYMYAQEPNVHDKCM